MLKSFDEPIAYIANLPSSMKGGADKVFFWKDHYVKINFFEGHK